MGAHSEFPSPADIWRRYDADEARLTAGVSVRMLELAGLRPGMRVLDLATGRGEPAVPAAQRVAPHGRVLGIDIDASMLAMAAERAAREGVSNLDLRQTSAEMLEAVADAGFDVALVRWGLMYFDAPVAALAAVRRLLAPGAALVAAFWAEPERVPYYTLPRQILARHLPLISSPDPLAPGTFRFADLAQIERDFHAAGYVIGHVEEMDTAVMEARTDAELIAWTRCFGMARLLKDAPSAIQHAWETELIAVCADRRDQDGCVRLGGVTRIVVARSVPDNFAAPTKARG